MHVYYTGFVIIAAILWGISGGLAGILMDKGWSPLVISFYRGAIGLVCLLFWLLLKRKGSKGSSTKFSSKTVWWAMLAGVAVAGNFSFYFLSISESGVAVASTLMYTAPIFVLMSSFLFRIESITPFKVISMIVVMGGISLLTNIYETGIGQLNVLGVIFGLLSGVSYALFIFGFKNASKNGRPPFILSIAFATFTIVLFLFIDHSEARSVLLSEDLIWFITLGIIGAGLSFYLYIEGLKKTSSSVASVIAMVEPVTASLFGLVVLGEVLTPTQSIGLVIILVTITMLSGKQKGYKRKKESVGVEENI
ncbi:DMT family transporter [Bacillus sp. RAR_GA_16]|uniref:DMT family transporter n=1 Tax=Bacillus sp. RAR_GA_16 TaxID=2876774 RepID=UPI001CC920C5|nr:EamA family transporter [Bacillus sp. RAR_GA_16]MCA0173039.1 DMT family transporter [Bacillus sp. RAR_GA_16]